ncbi:MAG TPA: hypothetical protein VFE58_17635 [Tepidisphaeraceae bacterium]|nr:hypothetical protein [Tepidisphaeraceae bacterium]
MLVLMVVALVCGCTRWVDYAESGHVDDWLRHPVLGDPSFDSFERVAGNPIHRGTAEFAWPVNVFLFVDPVGGDWYAYIGEYKENYGGGASRCLLYRSRDRGRGWERVGVMLAGDAMMFDRGGHVPDVSVVYDQGRYHMIYDWGEPDFNREGGIAYAWAERPEGPWHRAAEPITRRTTTAVMGGRYSRTYAATLVKREKDWLILGMTDVPPNAWAMFAMTAARAEGPYSKPVIVRRTEGVYYYPPLMEFFPAFVHGGYVYAPATSVAANRNFNVLFRVPIGRATEEGAWEIARHGSVWHAGVGERERYGIWGQTFSGQVLGDGTLAALFPSRDVRGVGTINLAEREWDRPLRERGFVLSGHEGAAMTLLRRGDAAGASVEMEVKFEGTVRLLLGHRGVLGPNMPTSGSTLHSLVMTRYSAVELTADGWRVIRVDERGEVRVVGEGKGKWGDRVIMRAEPAGSGYRLVLDGREVWRGEIEAVGSLGLWVDRWSRAEVGRFAVKGGGGVAEMDYLYTEALVGAGHGTEGVEVREGDSAFRFGVGAVVRGEGAVVKWNVWGTRVRLWSPRGEYGKVEVVVDGKGAGVVDLSGRSGSSVVWDSGKMADGPHAVVVRLIEGVMPVDSVEVDGR